MRISAWTLLLTLAVPGLAQAATVELISKTSTAALSPGYSTGPVLSADGRYVAFLSSAPDISPGQEDENTLLDVFLHDRVLGTTTLVSHAAGSPTRAASPGIRSFVNNPTALDISADGRYVAFSAPGVDLVPGAAGSDLVWNLFLWDRVTGTTTLVSHAAGSPGTAADDSSSYVRISADGNFLVFTSLATNLVAGQVDRTDSPGGTTDVFLWHRATDTATLVSRRFGTAAGTPAGTSATTGNQSSFAPVLSADGGVVVFATAATDLLPHLAGLDSYYNVYAYQRSTDTLSLVSRAATSPQVAASSSREGLAVSADGRYVAFHSFAGNLVPGQMDDSSSLDVFLYDRTTGEMRLASHRSLSPLLGGGGYFDATGTAMSADGRYMAFSSFATDLVPGQADTNGNTDIFVYDRDTGLVALASHRHDSATTAGAGFSSAPRLSADGRFLVFHSQSRDLVLGQTEIPAPSYGGTLDVFLYDRTSRSVTLASHTRVSASATGNHSSFEPVLSADGSVAAFLSEATDLAEGGQVGPYGFSDLFLHDRTSDEVTRASRHDPGLPPPVTTLPESTLGGLSADGRLATFKTRDDLFLRDTVADTALLTNPPRSFASSSVRGQGTVLSADGRFAALTAAQSTGTEGLYLYDRAAGTFTLVNREPGALPPLDNRPVGSPVSFALSADGRYLVYQCDSCFLLPGYPSFTDEIFLYDRLSGLNTLVSRAEHTILPAFPANGPSSGPAISPDGRYVVFWSVATNLVLRQVDAFYTPDLFVFDREAGPAGATALITHGPGSPERSATTLVPYSPAPYFLPPAVLSADGRFIAFQSVLPNLVEGQVDTNEGADVFLYSQGTRANLLVSHAASPVPVPAGIAGNAPSAPSNFVEDGTVSMSADGRFIAYQSLATDLVGDLAAGTGDTNGTDDVFLYDRLFGTNSLVSHNGGAPLAAANGASGFPRISADGRRVAFTSTATDLLPNETVPTGWHNLYVQDHGTGASTFVARAFRSSQEFFRYIVPQLSADGRRIGFNSEAPLVPGDYNGRWDVYLWKDDGGGTIPLPACKLLDTRRRADRPVLTSDIPRAVAANGRCGVPVTAKQVVVKAAVFNPSGKGNLRFYPGAVTAPPSDILRFERGTARAETFTVKLGTDGTLTILPFVSGRGTVHVAVEVTGYVE